MMPSIFVPAIVVAYVLGSIPFAQIIAKLHGKDLRTIGSGNIGATNLARAVGRTWGYVCFALDVLKGAIPVVAVRAIAGPPDRPALLALWLAVGVAAILGHVFPVFLRFKGGKGVATSFGVTLGLWPYFTICGLIALAVWVGAVLVWRYVSLASICASAAFPIALLAGILIRPDWDLSHLWPLVIAAVVIPAFVIVRHRANMRRLLAGTENKIRDKRQG
ncbi:MAG TPA: glycerol-3-phosphate 1-O-acyltransferase PlsY [Sedimentisphaerales bacterium]|jgi:glycerol-3-phosphate acyltransferase PlsY|nr:glycerol-3-phosphate 1-O-acyltransferase PlsY [Sedimentisphaerales bacterium]HNU28784.1 glycerol-3-phosphate 1-O-acyltransferase PlsY [Sedimentisphaerales bacterium]